MFSHLPKCRGASHSKLEPKSKHHSALVEFNDAQAESMKAKSNASDLIESRGMHDNFHPIVENHMNKPYALGIRDVLIDAATEGSG